MSGVRDVVVEASGQSVGSLGFDGRRLRASGAGASIVDAARRRGESDEQIWEGLDGWSNGYLTVIDGEEAGPSSSGSTAAGPAKPRARVCDAPLFAMRARQSQERAVAARMLVEPVLALHSLLDRARTLLNREFVRDRKGRFAHTDAADAVKKIDDILSQLDQLHRSVGHDDKEDIASVRDDLHRLRQQHHARVGKPVQHADFGEVDSEYYQNLSVTADRSDATVSVDFDDGGFFTSAGNAEDLASALDRLRTLPLPTDPGPNAGAVVIGEHITPDGELKAVRFADGTFEIGDPEDVPLKSEDPGVDTLFLVRDGEAHEFADLLEEVAAAALQGPGPQNRLPSDVDTGRTIAARLAQVTGLPVNDVSKMPPHLQKYWLTHEAWGVPGAFDKCVTDLREHGVPGHMTHGACANLYHEATGTWPGSHGHGRKGGKRKLRKAVEGRFHPDQLRDPATGEWVDMPGLGDVLDEPFTMVGHGQAGGFHVAAFNDPGGNMLDRPGRGVALRYNEDDGPIDSESDVDESLRVHADDVPALATAVDTAVAAARGRSNAGDPAGGGPVLVATASGGGLEVSAWHDVDGDLFEPGDSFVVVADGPVDNPLDLGAGEVDGARLTLDEAAGLPDVLRQMAAAKPKLAKAGVDPKKDRLRLDGRIELADGEKLLGSAKIQPEYGDRPILLAATDGPAGPRLRMSIFTDDNGETRTWTGGNDADTLILDSNGVAGLKAAIPEMQAAAKADRVKQQQIFEQTQAKVEALEQRKPDLREATYHEVPLTDSQQAQIASLGAQMEELRRNTPEVSEWIALHKRRSELSQMQFGAPTANGYEYVALPPDLKAEENRVLDRLTALQAHPGVGRFEELSDQQQTIERERFQRRPFTPAEQAEYDSIDAKVQALWDAMPPTDDKIAQGVIPGTAWGDLKWEVHGSDDWGDNGENALDAWDVRLAVAPPGSGPGWDIYGDNESVYAELSPAELAALPKAIAKVQAAGPGNLLARFDPSQHRDRNGRWSKIGELKAELSKLVGDPDDQPTADYGLASFPDREGLEPSRFMVWDRHTDPREHSLFDVRLGFGDGDDEEATEFEATDSQLGSLVDELALTLLHEDPPPINASSRESVLLHSMLKTGYRPIVSFGQDDETTLEFDGPGKDGDWQVLLDGEETGVALNKAELAQLHATLALTLIEGEQERARMYGDMPSNVWARTYKRDKAGRFSVVEEAAEAVEKAADAGGDKKQARKRAAKKAAPEVPHEPTVAAPKKRTPRKSAAATPEPTPVPIAPSPTPASKKRAARKAEPPVESQPKSEQQLAAEAHVKNLTAGLPPAIRKDIHAELMNQASVTPKAVKSLRAIGYGVHPDGKPSNPDGTAQYHRENLSIDLNPRLKRQRRAMLGDIAASQADGYLAPTGSTPLGGIVAHEFGHHVARTFMGSGPAIYPPHAKPVVSAVAAAIGVQPPKETGRGAYLHTDLRNWMSRNRSALRSKVSEYGADSFHELLAEAWQEFSTRGPDARPAAKTIGSALLGIAGRP